MFDTNRSCGSCTLCCTVYPVEELAKPALVPCKHLRGGCSIHEQKRPIACTSFVCLWLDEGEGSDAERPDLTGLVLHWQHSGPLRQTIWMVGATDQALDTAYAHSVTQRFVEDRIPVMRAYPSGLRELVFVDGAILTQRLREECAAIDISILSLSDVLKREASIPQ